MSTTTITTNNTKMFNQILNYLRYKKVVTIQGEATIHHSTATRNSDA